MNHGEAQYDLTPYYHIRQIKALPSIKTKQLFKDTKGYLWVATDEGLYRYNGTNARHFKHLANNDSTVIASDKINAVHEDSQHQIWVCTNNGLSRYTPFTDKIRNFHFGNDGGKKVALGNCNAIFQNSKGELWLATADKGVCVWNTLQKRFCQLKPIANASMFINVKQIVETVDHLMVLSAENGLTIIEANGKQHYTPYPFPTNGRLLPFVQNHPDEIWLSLGNVFAVYSINTNLFKTYPTASNYQSAADIDNNQWLVGNQTLSLFNHRTGALTSLPVIDNNNFFGVQAILKYNNSFFIASNTGVYLLNKDAQLFQNVLNAPTSNANFYCYDNQAATFYGCNPFSHTAISQLKGNIDGRFSLTQSKVIAENNFSCNGMVKVGDSLFIASFSGMYAYSLKNNALHSLPTVHPKKEGEAALSVCKADSLIVFGNYFSGIHCFNIATQTMEYHSMGGDTLLHQGFNEMVYDDLQNIWIGGKPDTLCSYNIVNRAIHYYPLPKASATNNLAVITHFTIDHAQRIWAGTKQQGVYVFDSKSTKWIKQLSPTPQLNLQHIYQLQTDANNNVWCSTNNGWYKINASNFHFNKYTAADGLANNDMEDSRFLTTNNGAVWCFGANNKLAAIAASSNLSTADSITPIIIDSVVVNHKSIKTDVSADNMQAFYLAANNKTFQLWFSAVNILQGESLSYYYQLEDKDDDWQLTTPQQGICYQSLSPGTHILHLKITNYLGNPISNVRDITIVVGATWYQTRWFNTLISLLLIAGAVLVYFQLKAKHFRNKHSVQ